MHYGHAVAIQCTDTVHTHKTWLAYFRNIAWNEDEVRQEGMGKYTLQDLL